MANPLVEVARRSYCPACARVPGDGYGWLSSGLLAQIRQALGDDRFGQVFAAGSWLSQQEAVAVIRDRPGNRTQPC
jgi:hypothetical protein